MKKLTLFSAFTIVFAHHCSAQGWGGTGTPTITQDWVGIGLASNPTAYLHIIKHPTQQSLLLKLEGNFYDPANPDGGSDIFDIFNSAAGKHYLTVDYKGGLVLGRQFGMEDDRLTVDNNISLFKDGAEFDDNSEHIIRAWGSKGVLGICQNKNYFLGPSIIMYGKDVESNKERDAGEMRLFSYGKEGRGITLESFDKGKNMFIPRLQMMNDGRIVIGSQMAAGNFADYKLSVDGNIVCKKAVVQTSNWADYVFEPEYPLVPLQDLELYIARNKHLPDVPSAQAVAENGVDVGDMNKILLQKVEELTLYVIDLKKENAALQQRMETIANNHK